MIEFWYVLFDVDICWPRIRHPFIGGKAVAWGLAWFYQAVERGHRWLRCPDFCAQIYQPWISLFWESWLTFFCVWHHAFDWNRGFRTSRKKTWWVKQKEVWKRRDSSKTGISTDFGTATCRFLDAQPVIFRYPPESKECCPPPHANLISQSSHAMCQWDSATGPIFRIYVKVQRSEDGMKHLF